MTAAPIISVSGLRGVVGQSLTPDIAIQYAAAFAAEAPPGPIVVGRDSRLSGGLLADAVAGGLRAAGRQVWTAGVTATPTLGVLVRRRGAAGGVQVTASHNPPPYNGLKLFAPEGRVLNAQQGERVRRRMAEGPLPWADHASLGGCAPLANPLDDHLDLVLRVVDADRIRAARFTVLLDANHGAGGPLGLQLLEALGCRVEPLGCEPDGRFAHPLEPTEAHLAAVCSAVPARQAAVGFCQDPDADRLALIDETGRYVGEEYTLALCLDHVLRQRRGPVVANCATSRMSQEVAERRGASFRRAAVGEANVVDQMLACGAVFGGEGNGGPIDPRVGYVRDSFVGMALILDAMAARRAPLSRLADALPRYAIRKTKAPLAPERVGPALASLQRRLADARADRLDGLRLDWPDRWLLVRPSNTEPIVRVIAEAPTAEQAEQLCREALEALR